MIPLSTPPAVDEPVVMHGLELENRTLASAVDTVVDAVRARRSLRIAFVNADCVNIAVRHRGYRDALRRADVRWADGVGVRLAARLRGVELAGNVNGTDLFPQAFERLRRHGSRVYLLGGAPEVATELAGTLSARYPGLQIAGARDGFFSPSEMPAVVADVRRSRADLLLTAMGAPRQELFNDALHASMGVPVVAGVGGLFNFLADRIPRAPRWMRDASLEWVHRLAMEPGRMWRRYLIGNLRFVVREAWISRPSRSLG